MIRCMLSVSCLCLLSAVCTAVDLTKVEIGKPAPNFTATGLDGKDFTLSEKLAGGKNIVLMFSRAHW